MQFVPLPNTVKCIPGRKSLANSELVFIADDLPPLGYKSYLITKEKVNSESLFQAKMSKQSNTENLLDIGDRVITIHKI